MNDPIFTLDCIKATLEFYDPETSTREELAECWSRCRTAIDNHCTPVAAEEMTAHIVAMEDADNAMELKP